LDRYLVKKGDRIKQLEKIGTVGQTGNATGPHLDFQLLVNGTHKNPRRNMEIAQSVHTVVPPLMTRFKAVRQERLTLLSAAAAPVDSGKRVAAIR
jgi:murein DD-endopeptidase MepM/ murein hydrolase activator NlpD